MNILDAPKFLEPTLCTNPPAPPPKKTKFLKLPVLKGKVHAIRNIYCCLELSCIFKATSFFLKNENYAVLRRRQAVKLILNFLSYQNQDYY